MNDAQLVECSASRWTGDESRCRWCDATLTGRRRRWCSDECDNNFGRNHMWSLASLACRRRDEWKCVKCGSQQGIQSHHLTPILGRHGEFGCHHHLDGLMTLCGPCHVEEHKRLNGTQRPAPPPPEGEQLSWGWWDGFPRSFGKYEKANGLPPGSCRGLAEREQAA